MSETSSSAPSPSPASRLSPVVRMGRWLLGGVLGPFLALGIVILIFGVADQNARGDDAQFLTLLNARFISAQVATVAVAALGMTVIIIAGGIDLSAGTAISFAAVVFAWCLREDVALKMVTGQNVADVTTKHRVNPPDPFDVTTWSLEKLEETYEQNAERLANYEADDGPVPVRIRRMRTEQAEIEPLLEPGRAEADRMRKASATWTKFTPWLAMVAGILAGCFAGWLNGILVSYTRIVPFIITLGTMLIFSGMAKQVASNKKVQPEIATQVPEWVQNFLSSNPKNLYPKPIGSPAVDGLLDYIRLPLGVWLVFAFAILLGVVLHRTVFGRHVFAIGSNENTARLCGVNVRRTKILVYTIGGLFIGIAGMYRFSRLSNADPTSGLGLELQVIAAVVIGGGSLAGGRGSVLGTLAGATIVAVIVSGCIQLGISNAVQDIVIGSIIIAAVGVDQYRRSRIET